jgi:hypothetical protein
VAPTGARAAAASDRIGGKVVEQTSFRPQAPTQPKTTAGVLWAQAPSARCRRQGSRLRAVAARAGTGARRRRFGAGREILKRALEVFATARRSSSKRASIAAAEPAAEAQAALMQAQAARSGKSDGAAGSGAASAALAE